MLDYTQLKSDADQHVRQELASIDEMSQDRLFVLVNKFDQKDRNGMNKEEVTTFVHGLMDGMLKAENIFPVSSKFGYLANRRVVNWTCTAICRTPLGSRRFRDYGFRPKLGCR